MQIVDLRETAAISEAAAKAAKAQGRMRIQLIDPGWGSSGYYSAEVLEQAAAAKVFPAGTHMYLDHPTESEDSARPERSVKDLAAVLTTDAVWNGSALEGEAQVFTPYREVIGEMKDAIGVSIRGSARVTENGQAEGRRGRIIEELVKVASVDFVTHAGRGGKVLEVLESARTAMVAQAVENGVEEATANEIRDRLETQLKDTYGGEKSWLWVKDFDDTHVWYSHETPESCDVYQLEYSVAANGEVTLSGDPIEVRQETKFVPATRPDSTTNPKSKESTMGKIEIDEAEHQRLVELAGRVESLESERDTEKSAREAAETALVEAKKTTRPRTPREVMEDRDKTLQTQVATLTARERARDIIAEELTEAWLPATTVARLSTELLADLPLVGEKLELDEAKLREAVVATRDQHEFEAAEALEAAGVGTPRGLASLRPAARTQEADNTEALKGVFQSFGLSESEATIAAKGR